MLPRLLTERESTAHASACWSSQPVVSGSKRAWWRQEQRALLLESGAPLHSSSYLAAGKDLEGFLNSSAFFIALFPRCEKLTNKKGRKKLFKTLLPLLSLKAAQTKNYPINTLWASCEHSSTKQSLAEEIESELPIPALPMDTVLISSAVCFPGLLFYYVSSAVISMWVISYN